MRRIAKQFGVAAWLALPAAPAQAQVIDILHSFGGGANDGKVPNGALTLAGSTLYGMTAAGGAAADGTIFQIGTGGADFALTHSFAGFTTDGANPLGSLTLSGPTLYGMTSGGGPTNQGTVFQIGVSGTGYGRLHQFTGGASDGEGPLGSLIQSGSTLYGMTNSGGNANKGTVFKINADGTGFVPLHSFAGGATDGQGPAYSMLTVAGSSLYGMTISGGTSGIGTIFRINTDGTSFSVIHSFNAATGDGWQPAGSLTLVGSTLFGMTRFGGAGAGTVFRINTDGTGYGLVYSFNGSPGDGANPVGTLTLAGSTLYGTTPQGGADGLGTLFGINTDGSDYNVLYSFTGGANDGGNPGDVIFSGSTLYGITGSGGAQNLGTVYSFSPIPEPTSFFLGVAGGGAILTHWRRQIRAA